jgi:hypothetical protein
MVRRNSGKVGEWERHGISVTQFVLEGEMNIILLKGSKSLPARTSDKCIEVKTLQYLEAVA